MSGEGEKEEFTSEDWMAYAEELERQLKEKDDEIAELNKGAVGRGRRRGNDNAAMLALEEEVASLQDKIKTDQTAMSTLRKDLADANTKISQLTEEKTNTERSLRAQTKQVEELERELKEARKKAQSAESQTKDFNKQKSVNVKLAQQMSEENEALREEHAELLEQIKVLQNEKKQMDEIIAKFAEERETLAALKDHGDVEKEQLRNELAELENDLAEASEHLQTALREAAMWEDKCKLQALEMTALRTKHASDLAREEAEKQDLRGQISHLKDNSKLGNAQRQAEEAEAKVKDMTQQLTVAQNEVKKMLVERSELQSRLAAAEDHIDEAVAERIASERGRAKALETALQSAKDAQAEEANHWESTQKERDELVKENDELKNWKAIYEAGHGLQQLALNQRKLTDDNRRLTQALEQRTTQYSALMDLHSALSLAFEKLQKETGRTVKIDLQSPDLAEEVQNTASGLQLQIRELEEQLNALEEDNSRLRKQLRTQVGTMTESGLKYPGLSPEQLVKVNEFAANLRDGKVELPLDDRSRTLLGENKQLKKDLATMNATLLKYEKNGGNIGAGNNETSSGGILSDAFGVDIKTLLQENAAMQQALNEIKARLEHSADSVLQHEATATPRDGSSTAMVVRSGGGGGGFNGSELARILANNNDMILKELEMLRRQQQTMQLMALPTDGQYSGSGSTSQPVTARRPPLAQAASRVSLSQPAAAPRASTESPFPWTPFTVRGGAGSAPPTAAQHTLGHRPNQFYTPQTPMQPRHLSVPQTPAAHSSYGGVGLGPQTPFGKTLLADAVQPLHLPPEEWAGEVKDLYAQLVQCLEQLFERDLELEQTRGFVKTYESQLGDMKLQMTILYHDFAQRSRQWSDRERADQEERKTLQDEIDDLRLKVRRLQEMNLLYQREDPEALQNKLSELTRRAMILEVNEAMLSRKYISATETLALEQKRRTDLQADFVEMEGSLKERILFLEHFKETATLQLTRLQAKLDNSVPAQDFQAALTELSSLREDHLHTLRQHAETNAARLSVLDSARELRSVRLVLSEARHETERLRAANQALHSQLLAEKDALQRLAAATQSSAEVAALVTELARFKGETSRLDFELAAQNKRVESLTQSLSEVLTETDGLSKQLAELQTREEDLLKKESDARNSLIAFQLKFEGGLTREAAQALEAKLELAEERLRSAEAESKKQKELAEIASSQATQARHYQANFETEVKELREYCAKLESRGDDEVIIGRMQRELLSTKASYRAFARKYQVAREGIRHREVALRLVEGKLLSETQARHNDVGRYQQALSSLAAAMETLKSSVLQIDFLPSAAASSSPASANSSSQSQHLSHQYKRTSYVTFPIGAKVAEVSTKLDSFSVQAQEAVQRAQEKEDEARKWQHDFEEVSVDKTSLTKRLQDLNAVLAQSPAKQQALAARIIALSEENRLAKVAQLQARRQVSQLRDEMKHLRSTITQLETEVVTLERAKVEAEAQALRQKHALSVGASVSDPLQLFDTGSDNNNSGVNGEAAAALDPLAIIPFFTTSAAQPPPVRLSIDTDNLDREFDADQVDRRLSQSRDELSRAKKELTTLQNMQGTLQEDLQQLNLAVEEKDAQLTYYEKLLRDNGLGGMLLRPGGTPYSARRHTHSSSNSNRNSHDGAVLSAVEQQQMQAAATATISSLKQLLEEKNRTIENYRDKVERLLSDGYGSGHKSRATKRADDLLDAMDHLPPNSHPSHPSTPTHLKASAGMQSVFEETIQKLQSQLDAAESIVSDKDALIAQLEQKLQTQTNQRERAEIRCAEGIDEMEAMKMDMVTLLRQLQESEAKCAALQRTGRVEIHHAPILPASATPEGDAATDAIAQAEESRKQLHELQKKHTALQKRFKDCEKLLRAKEDKVRGYRNIIVRLKEEFIKTEESFALQELQLKSNAAGGSSGGAAAGGVSADELRHMRDKVAALSDGLKATKADLDAAKKSRDKLNRERQEAQEALEKSEEKCKKAEQQAVHAQNVAARYRKELEEARKKEVRLREKLKDFIGKDTANNTVAGDMTAFGATSTTHNKKDSMQKLKDKNDGLEREVELLKAQLALYTQQEAEHKAQSKGVVSEAKHSDMALSSTAAGVPAVAMDKTSGLRSTTGGNVLGTGTLQDDGSRAPLAARWEAEKTLQKRVQQLEKKLQDMAQDNEQLRDTVARAQSSSNAARSSSPTRNRRGNAATSNTNNNTTGTGEKQSAHQPPRSTQDLLELDATRRRVFELEAELSQVRKRAEVDLTGQVRQLQQQLASATHQLRAAEAELAQLEERRKKEQAGHSGLRASEDRYLREERLRDDLDFARRQRLELEAQLLERDAQTLELRFESEEKAAERLRLQRRVKEQEELIRQLREQVGQTHDLPFSRTNLANTNTGTTANNRREAELESVVESMKRVIEKLRGDNDRLRRGITGPLAGTSNNLLNNNNTSMNNSLMAPASPPRSAQNPEWEKKLAAERKKNEKLNEELAQLKTKAAEKEDNQSKMQQKTQQISTLQKKLQKKEEDLQRLVAEKETLTRRVATLETQIQSLGNTAANNNKGNRPGLTEAEEEEIMRQMAGLQAENDSLRLEMSDLRKKFNSINNNNNSVNNQARNATSTLATGDIEKLREENAKLKSELAAFDLDFFEEIENLKFAHAEAIRKLKVFEQRYGPLR